MSERQRVIGLVEIHEQFDQVHEELELLHAEMVVGFKKVLEALDKKERDDE